MKHLRSTQAVLPRVPFCKVWPRALAALSLCAACGLAQAGLQDEIQVYTDEINEPGEYGVEVHMNSTPSGISTPSYPGEVTNHHGVRLTPEFSLGLGKTTDIGLYVPTVYTPDGQYLAAGLKLRFKWLPIQSQEHDGFFAGMNFEIGQVRQRFSESPRGGEIRNILGWRGTNWLLVLNPIFEFDASTGFSHQPALQVATKVNRRITEGWWLGWERYNDRGPLHQPLPASQQPTVNYLVLDYEGHGFDLNVGIGRGNAPQADHWTFKSVLGYAFQR